MKVAVITRHGVTNYGSLMQAVALQNVIEKLGHSCETIDYIRRDEDYASFEKTELKNKRKWNQNPISAGLYLILRQPGSIVVGKQFEKWRKEYLCMTRRYASAAELAEDKPEADVYMTGSDQVWGPVVNGTYDDAYCLSFTGDGDKRTSYASSFGRTVFDEERIAFFKHWLKRYDKISVREDSAVSFLHDIGFDVSQVLDPTLLMEPAEWDQYCRPVKQQKYVLAYQLHSDPTLGRYAEKVAKAKGLPLIRISVSVHQIFREGKFKWCPHVGEFLSYIKNADCLITDSFHGTAFAILFNTPFVEVLPNNNTGTRNMSILKLTGLSNRILRNENDVALAMQPMDFTEANAILDENRQESIAILKQMIEQ